MTPGTPKFKSSEFKEALAALKEVFDAHALGIVLVDALDRKSAEAIYNKNLPSPTGQRVADLQKAELSSQITGWFFSNDDVAYQLMKELDRACDKERHIVASIPEEQAPERIGSYRAMALKRERAKLVWALSRDARASVRKLAARVINEFFREVADVERAKQIVSGEVAGAKLEDVELAKRLQSQAEKLSEANTEVSDLKSKLMKFEEERAKLLVEIGSKERTVRQAFEAREGVESELKRLRGSLADLERAHAEAEGLRRSEREARAMADELAARVRRLEKLAGASDTLAETQSKLDQSNRRIDELTRQVQRTEQAHKREREDTDKERSRLRSELDEAREELHRARKRVTELESGAAAHAIERPEGAPERTVVLLDQANLAASAAVAFGRKVNFANILDHLRPGRHIERAVAFVVDNGGANFDGFCDSLRRAGWDLRIKKPKRFADGTSKADWDMGIAVEAFEATERVERLVLVSGDGDFAPLIRHLRRRGRVVEVASFSEGLSSELVQVADRVIALDRASLE